MAGTSYTKEFNDITTLVGASMLPEIFKQTFDDQPTWGELTKNQETDPFAHDRLEIKVQAGRNKTLRNFTSATTEIDLYDTQHLTSGWVSPAMLGGVVVFTELEKIQVEGNSDAAKSLVRIKYEALEDSVGEVLGLQVFGDGTAGTTMGLGAWLPVSPGSYTVAALSEASYPMWVPYYEGGIGAYANFGYQGATKDKIIRVMRTVADGNRKPNKLICDDETWALWHDKNAAKIQFHKKDDYGNVGGYDAFILGVPLIPDHNCDAGTIFGINTKYVKYVVSKGANARMTETRTLEKMPLISYNFWWHRYQVVFTRRNVHFRIDGIS
jgi:hypothetical protein